MKLEVNGVQYSNFESANATISLDDLSNSFSFNAVSSGGAALPFKGGDRCNVLVNSTKVLSGVIEVVQGSYDSGSHLISIKGRDFTRDIVDSNINDLSDLQSTITLKSAIEIILNHIGSSVSVIDEVNPPTFTPNEDIEAPDPGVNCFQFLESLARKRQVILTSNSEGDIVIIKSPGGKISALLSLGGNVKSATFNYDITDRFNKYVSKSSSNPSTFRLSSLPSKDATNQSGEALDTSISSGRQFVFIHESPASNTQNKNRAEWENTVRKARGLSYTAVVTGYTYNKAGEIWGVNKIVSVLDNFAGINGEMLINKVNFSFDRREGAITTLNLIGVDAYNIIAEQPKSTDVGSKFVK